MTIQNKIEALLKDPNLAPYPIHEWAFVDPATIPFSAEVREACARNACGCYGKYWTCPPAVGDWEELRDHFHTYPHAFLYTTKHDLEDSFDVDGMEAGREAHSKLDDAIFKLLTDCGAPFELLGAEGCNRCSDCTYPDAPCRFPDTIRISMEATGISVVNLAKDCQIHYINGANTVTYFSIVFYR